MLRTSTLALAFLVGPLSSLVGQSYTWIQNLANGHYYALTASMSWTSAEAEAQRVGGHLATIRSQAETDWIVTNFGPVPYCWMGASDSAVEGVWEWASDEPVSFTNWCPGEPNNLNEEDYGALDLCAPGGWNDGRVQGPLPGLIEIWPGVSTYVTYRTACSSSSGLSELVNVDLPRLGQPFHLQVTGLGAFKIGYLLFGFQDQQWGLNALPLDLTAFGAPSCFINIDPVVQFVVPTNAQGNASPTVMIPSDVGLLGSEFFNQFVTFDDAPPGRAMRITTTNAGRGVVGPALVVPNMVAISPGTFAIGSNATAGEPYWSETNERPVHQVTISRPFWIGKYEVQQAEYQALMGSNPSYFQGTNLPVEQVSWNDAVAYCLALTVQEASAGRVPAGYQYRLPTEAEWEYCCRAGTTTEFHYGISLLCGQANFSFNNHSHSYCGSSSTVVVGNYVANAWGLHDMHGNVWEWCLDAWDGSANFPGGAVSDPYVTIGSDRVHRGGSWGSSSNHCRSADRERSSPTSGDRYLGFRVVLAPVLVP